MVKNLSASAGDSRDKGLSLHREDPLEKEMATHSIFLPGQSHEQRNLVGYSPYSCKESDMTMHTHNSEANFWLPFLFYSPSLSLLFAFCFLIPLSPLQAQIRVVVLTDREQTQFPTAMRLYKRKP